MSEHPGNLTGHKAFSTIRTHQNVRNLLVTDVSRNFANSWAAGLLRIGIGCKKNLFLPSFYFRQWRLFQEEKEEGWPLRFFGVRLKKKVFTWKNIQASHHQEECWSVMRFSRVPQTRTASFSFGMSKVVVALLTRLERPWSLVASSSSS